MRSLIEIPSVIPLLQIAAWLIALAFVWVTAVFVRRRLMPLVDVRLTVRGDPAASGLLVLELEAENVSPLIVYRENSELHVVEFGKPSPPQLLPDSLPREESAVPSELSPNLVQWNDPREVMRTTFKLEPGEKVHTEALYVCSEGSALFCRFSFRYKPSRIFKWLYRSSPDSHSTVVWVASSLAGASSSAKADL